MFGEMQVVLYDERPDSPTKGLVAEIVLSEHRRRLMNIPAGILACGSQSRESRTSIVVNFQRFRTTTRIRTNTGCRSIPIRSHTVLRVSAAGDGGSVARSGPDDSKPGAPRPFCLDALAGVAAASIETELIVVLDVADP